MEAMEEKHLPKTYNTAIFAAFVVGFLLHAAIIFVGGIGWTQITEEGQKLHDRISQDGREWRDRVEALEKLCRVPHGVVPEKSVALEMDEALETDAALEKDEALEGVHVASQKREVISSAKSSVQLQLRQEIKSEVQSQLSDVMYRFSTELSGIDKQIGEIKETITTYHRKKTDVKCATGYKLNPYRGTCVRAVKTKRSWFDAKTDCERKGEFLATFDTVESASWFRQQQLTAGWNDDSWIAGRRQVGRTEYRWYGIDTGLVSISYWGVGEPNGRAGSLCMYTYHRLSYYWDDNDCNSKKPYVCEQKSD